MSGIPSNIHQGINQWTKIRVCYKLKKMFLIILEDGDKITRFWGEFTARTHHVKLPVRETV